LSGVAYGEGAVWIADAADAQNAVTRFDPKTLGTTSAKIPTGLSGDDIAVAPRAVLVWEPGDGHLTRVDSATIEAAGSQKPRG
jgi:DNA-binding beta-propeller fold protein YncE